MRLAQILPIALLALSCFASVVEAGHVRGHYRRGGFTKGGHYRSGTYVRPHERRDPGLVPRAPRSHHRRK